MPAAGLENTTGTRLYIAAGEPASMTAVLIKALSRVEIVGFVSLGPMGDTASDVSEAVVSEDRILHTNGTRDGGSIPLVVQHRTTDPGMALIKTNKGNLNTIFTFVKIYRSGDVEAVSGIVSPYRSRPTQGGSIRGYTLEIKANSDFAEFTSAAWLAA